MERELEGVRVLRELKVRAKHRCGGHSGHALGRRRTPAATGQVAPDRGRAGRGHAREKAGMRERPGRLALVGQKQGGGPLSQEKAFSILF
jgi:hypothetical protein